MCEDEKESLDSGSSVEDDASECSVPTSESSEGEELHWLLPKGEKTRLHRASGLVDHMGSAIPRCRTRSQEAFAWGYEEGRSTSSAMAADRKWCKRCFKTL